MHKYFHIAYADTLETRTRTHAQAQATYHFRRDIARVTIRDRKKDTQNVSSPG